MNAERVNLQCRRGDVSGVISNVDRRQYVEQSITATANVVGASLGKQLDVLASGRCGQWAVGKYWGEEIAEIR